ncbi:MAG TPA: leucyl/phenylalanyl-tRNA--protein transferase [Patescibacteria group bacterium]|nr:leucyl/phenylalanyl-tRNA--protein transferase [Patescibacteria group bacterium]
MSSVQRDTLTPELLLAAYSQGYFPMAEDDDVYWHWPDPRGIIPLDGAKISRSLRQVLKKGIFTTTIDSCFKTVMERCAARQSTWISDEFIHSYTQLHERGNAHSVETWHNGELVGGLYGVAIGGAFFGESMFSTMSDASKVAFARLVEILKNGGFILLDTQYINPHTESLGAIEIPGFMYASTLQKALMLRCAFK